ncbi:MAG: GNAT family N-acetyltransferase [Candidatus Hodarchaeota archaeon]
MAHDSPYATTCVITLLQSLEDEIKHIGLNVKADNVAALKLYQKTGFIPHLEYEEAFFKKRNYYIPRRNIKVGKT